MSFKNDATASQSIETSADRVAGERTGERLNRVLSQCILGFDPARELAQQLDSLALFALAGRIEDEFKIKLYSVELTPENLGSLEDLCVLIDSKIK